MISQTNNEDITGKIEDVVDQKISQIDIITRDTVEQVVQEAIQGGGGSGGTSDTAKRIEDNGCSVEFSTEKGVLNVNGSEDRNILRLMHGDTMQAGLIYMKVEDNSICTIGSDNSVLLSNAYNINTKKTTTELHGNNIKLEGNATIKHNATIEGDLTVKGKIINNFDINVKYQIVGDPMIYDTGNVLNNIIIEEAEFYEIIDDSLFPEEYKTSNLQYPYKYRIHKDSENKDHYILLRIDKDNKYTYNLTNGSVSSNFDKSTTTEIRPCDTPLLAVNGVKITSLDCLYQMHLKLETIDFGNDFDTSYIQSMFAMFSPCTSLKTIKLSNFNTSRVSNMQVMFGNTKIQTIDLLHFDTSNVIDMKNMFKGCTALTQLELGSFDTSKVENMEGMFSGCTYLTTLELSSFNTSNVKKMNDMFDSCKSLTSLDLSHFDTTNVENVAEMFRECDNLSTLNLSNWNNSKLTDMTGMFYYCGKLTNINLTNFCTPVVQVFYNMFSNCTSLTSLDLSSFNTSMATEMSNMFLCCRALKTLSLSDFNIPSESDKQTMFIGCSALESVVIKTEYADGIEQILSYDAGLNTKTPDSPSSGYTTYTRSESHTITHLTNVSGEIGTFCETNGGIFDGYIKTASTDCICKVVQSNTLNSKIVGIICDKNKFASHGDVLVKVVPGTYNLGDILCPDITGKARVATETEKQFMMINAIPRPKITAFTNDQSLVACFIV